MKIAVIGTGRVGRAVGGGLAAAGHDVVFGSRGPGPRTEGLPAAVMNLPDAVGPAEVVVDAVPGQVALDALNAVGRDALAGKILLEVANDLTQAFELAYPNGSLGAAIQEAFPATRVVKSLNTVQSPLMNNPSALSGPSSVFLAGNDAEAKSVVSGLLADLGWKKEWQVDLGDIAQARATEHFIFLSAGIARALGTVDFNIAVIR